MEVHKETTFILLVFESAHQNSFKFGLLSKISMGLIFALLQFSFCTPTFEISKLTFHS